MSNKINWDEYDGEVIDGIRYANSFTANMAKNSRIIGAEEERQRILAYLKEKGVLRNNLFDSGLVAVAEWLTADKAVAWRAIDLPFDLGSESKQEGQG
jgi:hypothetical protein